ncbi:hypothetical protein [Ureibacillus xyleni]|uniref:hypothetical protein n=1 Tax=Ureibacillus xyleni TaxID=614648 RepID=UPI000BE22A4E|nr:hypothetical protein [Ureibacillus xyleni]
MEYQTRVKKHDSFRFARYVLDLYNKYKDNKEISKFLFQSVVIYAPHIKRSVVNAVFDIGAIRYNFFPLFLNEVKKEDDYEQIVDKIRQNPNFDLTEEEKMVILYRPLFNSTKEEIENKALNVVRDIQEMADSSENAKLTGTLFVLVKKYLSLEGQEKIWEVLEGMDIVQERFEQKHQELTKELFKELLIEAIKEGDSSQSINRIIKKGKFSEEEVETIYREIDEN